MSTKKVIKKAAKLPALPKYNRRASTLQKLDSFVRSIQEAYLGDPSCPGVIISFIPSRQEFYGSVVRYRASYGKESYTVFNAYNPSLEGCLDQLMTSWKNKLSPTKKATEEFLKLF